MTTAVETLEWWKEFARTHNRAGGDNYVPAGAGTSYIFDTNPRRFESGALQGHIFRKDEGSGVQDIGVYKIAADGKVISIPAEVAPYLTAAPADCQEHTVATRTDWEGDPNVINGTRSWQTNYCTTCHAEGDELERPCGKKS